MQKGEFMNRVQMSGRLTADPMVRWTESTNSQERMCIARYTLAINRRGSRNADAQNSADFVPCVVFGKNAEVAEKYFHKGTKLIVSGRLQSGSYTNKDGQKVYTLEVVADDQEFAESRNTQYAAEAQNSQEPQQNQESIFQRDYQGGYAPIPDNVIDDLPFIG